jgi:hypothetical protein
MNRRVQSSERYEDDILAFLMDGLLEEEGRALLEENERLNADPAAAIPAELDERCRALLQSAFPDKPLKRPKRVTWKILKRVLIAAVLAATLFVTAYAAVPEFRAGVLNFWTEVKEIGTTFHFFTSGEAVSTPAPSSPLVIKDGMPFEFSYVPEGYELFLREAYDQGVSGVMYQCSYGCTTDKFVNFDFQISPISTGTGLFIDTEDAQVINIKIRGYDGQLIQKRQEQTEKEYVMYLWFDLENELMFYYNSVGIPFEESQRIFDGIVIYGYEADTPAPTPAPSSPLALKDGMPFEFSYVPEEYELFSREAYDEGAFGIHYRCAYINSHDAIKNFIFEIEPIDEYTMALVDTENLHCFWRQYRSLFLVRFGKQANIITQIAFLIYLLTIFLLICHYSIISPLVFSSFQFIIGQFK